MTTPTATPSTTGESPMPFRRPMAVTAMRRDVETSFRIAAEPAELAELARFLEVERIDRVTLAGFISPTDGDGWRVRGRLVAKLEQSCVVSLVPIRIRHDAEVERSYLPADQIAPEPDMLFSHDDADAPDPFIDSIDPARLAVDSLVLMIDPFPRAADAKLNRHTYGPPGITPLSDEASRPFAGLAALKTRTREEEG